METALIASNVVLWLVVIILGFLLFASFRQIGILSWRLEQLAATTPSRIERNGLKPGTKAPDFSLTDTSGREHSLQDYRGRTMLLVFTEPGCGSCSTLAPDLNKFVEKDALAVLAVSNADPEANRRWREEVAAKFPVLSQEHWSVSKKYQTFATPFAFLVDEEGVIRAQGIVNNRQHLALLFASAKRSKEKGGEAVSATAA
jgi:methylamine dehydrogenase accessory protein MauD